MRDVDGGDAVHEPQRQHLPVVARHAGQRFGDPLARLGVRGQLRWRGLAVTPGGCRDHGGGRAFVLSMGTPTPIAGAMLEQRQQPGHDRSPQVEAAVLAHGFARVHAPPTTCAGASTTSTATRRSSAPPPAAAPARRGHV